ncbi:MULTISPECIES: acetate--CoA ligase family protein [unclassified Sphingobium]|uniref:acetate--CoA ligase family protein n=1 Tax=unclassified Sphingobium TaxID=2611147 RepID=UPI0022252353|nr:MULTISPECIES: acetate--CoA ligase family protein [unclassified Sphingobium]MCW2350426.1 acyl-CoA synthetase (NDP forming) [Sphingobium sp. B12D2B]MCW2369529.1 acyl-CoA synthetase (NDP forming) [Sphingobium sp. B11D3D]
MTVEAGERPQAGTRDINRLLRPRSIAIVGASETPGSLGASVLANLVRNDFSGDIHLVNPKRETISGRPAVPSVEALPEGVDCAILAIPRVAVLDTMRQLAARKAGAAIIFAAGFAEGGEQGMADQQEIGRIAREAGIVVEGPNCLGSVNYLDRIPLTFIDTDIKAPSPGGVGIVSQSGAMAAVLAVMLESRTLDLTYSVSTGNEAGSGVEDYVEFMIADEKTRIIAMIVEQFRDPARFLALMDKARAAGKLVALLHPGKSSAARESAATHTGAMAGDYKLMRAKVERAGIVVAETLEELGDITEIAARCPALPSGGTAVLGESGALKALTLDLAEELDLALPTLDDSNAPALRAALPEFVPVSNPLDLTAQGLVDPDMYYRTLAALFEDDRVGTIFAGIIQTNPATIGIKLPPFLKAVRELKATKPVIFGGVDEGAHVPADWIEQLRAEGIPYFPTTERALRAIKRLSAAGQRDATKTDAAPASVPALASEKGVVPEYKAKALLAPLGIPFPKGQFAATVEEAIAAADAIGGPVVMKAQAAALSHKSDAGGVALNLVGADAIRAAWDKMFADVKRYDASIILDGVLIEAMGARGMELIVGAKNDPQWGPVILAGFGGVTAEILQDVRLLSPDMTKAAIVGELGKLKQAALLNGYRGAPALDVEAVADLIGGIGRLLRGEPRIQELDLNPVVVYPKGQGVVALDALMLVD